MANTGWRRGGTVDQIASDGATWGGFEKVNDTDLNSFAESNRPKVYTNVIFAKNFGFASLIGEHDTIDGIEVSVRTGGTWPSSGTVTMVFRWTGGLYLHNVDTVPLSTTSMQTHPDSAAPLNWPAHRVQDSPTVTLGSATSKWSTANISTANVRSSDFGFFCKMYEPLSGLYTAKLYDVQMRVHFTPRPKTAKVKDPATGTWKSTESFIKDPGTGLWRPARPHIRDAGIWRS